MTQMHWSWCNDILVSSSCQILFGDKRNSHPWWWRVYFWLRFDVMFGHKWLCAIADMVRFGKPINTPNISQSSKSDNQAPTSLLVLISFSKWVRRTALEKPDYLQYIRPFCTHFCGMAFCLLNVQFFGKNRFEKPIWSNTLEFQVFWNGFGRNPFCDLALSPLLRHLCGRQNPRSINWKRLWTKRFLSSTTLSSALFIKTKKKILDK